MKELEALRPQVNPPQPDNHLQNQLVALIAQIETDIGTQLAAFLESAESTLPGQTPGKR